MRSQVRILDRPLEVVIGTISPMLGRAGSVTIGRSLPRPIGLCVDDLAPLTTSSRYVDWGERNPVVARTAIRYATTSVSRMNFAIAKPVATAGATEPVFP
jgi:hypothetical protein